MHVHYFRPSNSVLNMSQTSITESTFMQHRLYISFHTNILLVISLLQVVSFLLVTNLLLVINLLITPVYSSLDTVD